MQLTVNQLAEKLNVEYAVASAVVKLMVSQGKASEVGKQPTATGKGKPATIFEIPNEFTLKIAA